MAVRSDVNVLWYLSPRIVVVAAPSTEITLQDLHDTLRAAEDSAEGEGYDILIDSAGKETLGGGVQVGITATLLNARLAFEARTTPLVSATATSADSAGTRLIDNAATFITSGVDVGHVIHNEADGSFCSVLIVESETQLFCTPLAGGAENDWDIGDGYAIYEIEQCRVSGGNLVAVDDLGGSIAAIFPTANTQVLVAAASSSTLVTPLSVITRGQDVEHFPFIMRSASTHLPTPGFTVSGFRRIDGGSYVPLSGSISEVANGEYEVDKLDGDLDLAGRVIMLKFTAPGADTTFMTLLAA